MSIILGSPIHVMDAFLAGTMQPRALLHAAFHFPTSILISSTWPNCAESPWCSGSRNLIDLLLCSTPYQKLVTSHLRSRPPSKRLSRPREASTRGLEMASRRCFAPALGGLLRRRKCAVLGAFSPWRIVKWLCFMMLRRACSRATG